ncbi:sacsin-like isoform X1 [Engraulis encrasicolus]|uniref:sacsin-like isoform X1 n=1 Tax=Engraulis encrasicolus TaxID=184585 RepID=UPI002FD36025
MSVPARKGRKKKNTFGATSPPFIDYLKDILRRYPDGGQILKELIQNADDAGASEVVFIHDERTYGRDSLWSEDLDKYQGPALYAFNNAVFTEEDWHGIQATGRSVKRNDPNRVGRFGIGFNSVYHITDVPSIFSSKYLGMLDPQEKIFGDREGGFRWSLDDDDERNVLLTLKDQFQPLRDIVQQVSRTTWEKAINEDQCFEGTLFRFPLRSESSEISDNLYNSSKVVELFDSFIADADISLLFLRHVSNVSLMHIDSSGSAVTRLTVSVSSITACSDSDSTGNHVGGTTVFKTISADSPSEGEKKTKWLVTSYCLTKGKVAKIDSLAEKLCYSPQVDLAFPCDREKFFSDGRLSCFLPLPNNESNRTGLPVHINACFGLTDNRRQIKWQDEDQKNDEAAQWNEILMTDVLPLSYLKMILDAIQCCRNSILSATSVYNMWPNIIHMQHKEKWHEIAKDVLKRLLIDQPVFSLAKDEMIWVTPSEAVFPADDIDDPALTSALARVLMTEGENLVDIPQHVIDDVREVFPQPYTLQWITPQFARDVLHRCMMEEVSRHDKLSLLDYVLSDGKYEELEGLQLLPLTSGIFKTFSDWDDCTALIDNEEFPRELLPFCEDTFVSQELSTSSLDHLRNLATKGIFKIINLDRQNVADLTRQHLPLDWKIDRGYVTWDLDNPKHPRRGWLVAFWKYLNSHWDDLSHFVGMPIVAVEPFGIDSRSLLLAKLEENSTLVFQHSKHSSLSDQVQNVVRNVGGTVIERDECLKHNDIETFVFPPSPKNLLKVFLNISSDRVINGIHSTPCKEKEELKSVLSSLDSLSSKEQNIVSQMPLFQLMSGEYVCVQGKLAVVLNSLPTIPSDLPILNSVIQCATEADRRLLTMLKVKLLDTAHLALHLVSCIETGSFSPVNEKKTMLWILQHGATLFSQNVMLYKKCKDLKFVEREGPGQNDKASSMFDPSNETFKKIFETKFFPSSDYTMTQQILQSLKQLGLKSNEKDISPSHVLDVAETIEKTQTSATAWDKADAFLRVLNDHDLISNFSPCQLKHLQNTLWFPCEKPSISTKDLNAKDRKRAFYKPCDIRHARYHTVIGYVMPVIAELNEKVCTQLGLLNPPPAEKVMENLSVLKDMSQTIHDLEKDVQFKTTLLESYKFMQDHVGLFSELIKKRSFPCLWIDNHFVSPSDVILAYPSELDLTSYIEKVPDEYLPFEKLWTELGVKSTLSADEIENILHDIKDGIDQRNPPFGTLSELKVSVNILNWMRKMKKPAKDDTPIPVQAENQMFTLQPASTTVFCDISKEGLLDLKEDHEDFHVLHEEILPVTADWLNIPLLSTRILKPEFIGIEQCGQREPITQRIKNILREYDEDGDLFKELLQNAEDAGAKTCKFMVDFRKHTEPADSLIDRGMSQCSGPCLWAFNDELFSDEDWENITKVGSASKETKVEKIGKFGIGFNAVYHVTDVPFVLSGKKLLIFDPNVTHLKKFIKNTGNPGIKLDLFHERIFRRFPGQFRSFEGIFECDFSEKSTQKFYKGTLMKLPFRTPEESNVSEISTKMYDTDRIIELKKDFNEKADTHLLFLRNVEKLSLQTLPENTTTPPKKDQTQTLVQITRKVLETIEIKDGISKDMQRRCMKSLMRHYPKCADVIDGSKGTITEIMQSNIHGSDCKHWLLFSCFGVNSSLKMALEKNELNVVSLPIGGVAVPLVKDHSAKWATNKSGLLGQAFSFLPMSLQTGLPVNINGSFAVMSNRKCLWETGPKAEWNKALLKDAVTSAYISALLVLKKLSEDGSLSNYLYYKFWPNKEEVGTAFQPLVDSFYSAIAEGFCNGDLELFSDGKNWCSLDNAKFLDPVIAQHKEVGPLAEKMFQSSQHPGTCAVSLPSWVRKSLIKSGFEDIVKMRTLTWADFFQEVVLKNLHSLECHDRNSIILSAIDLCDDDVDELLKGHCCIPSKSGELLYIKKAVNPSGKVACLYDDDEGRFLGGTGDEFCSPKRIQRLIALGMLNDHLPLEDVTERAGTIQRVWEKDKSKAVKRLQCLFELIEELPADKKSHHWSSLQNTLFIPALLPVNMECNNNVTVALKKPSQVYHSSCRNLVNMTEFTVDHEHLKIHEDNKVLEKLGVRKEPPLYMVLRQLDEASRCEGQDQSLFSKIAHDTYSFLNEWLNKDGDPTQIAEFAKSVPFVFVENKFVHVGCVAKDQDFEAKPYLCVLPTSFTRFNTLWECVGMQQNFTPQQFATVLHEIESRYGPNPLSETDLNICLDILCKGLLKTEDAGSQNYLVPDENSVLRPSSDLHYNDSPWMPVTAVTLCHNRISREVARHFGVKTTRHHTLQNHLVDGFPFYAREFAQHENLTVRIKNIIDAYPSKKDIIKELIQNADDAEATEIHFIWDKRKHGTEKTFDKKWNSLQGPALCVYNNKVFTDTDLEGIQRLGEGGKRDQYGKTGKFGLGFNSVYHLTDCPSILTEDKWLCISDPHVKYLKLATKQSPGCMFKLEEEFKESFTDVYDTFLPSDFKLTSGTMFRFPLRTWEMAGESEICKMDITDNQMMDLLEVFAEDSEGLILFLKHVKKIQFHTISPDSNELLSMYTIEKELPEKSKMSIANFQCQVQNSVVPCEVIYSVIVSSADQKGQGKSQWVIAEQSGPHQPSPTKTTTPSKMILESEDSLTPHTAVAACIKAKTSVPEFIGKLFCSLPLPGSTGLPVHINGNFEVDSSRRGLWKADEVSTKIEWNEYLKLDIISHLYADLLKHIQMTIETGEHHSALLLGSKLDSTYLKFFPVITRDVQKEWHTMINHVYKSISERDLSVIPILHTSQKATAHLTSKTSLIAHNDLKYHGNMKCTVIWSNVCKQSPVDSPHFMKELKTAAMLSALEDLGLGVVPWSYRMIEVSEGFKTADVKVMELCPHNVREYLKEKPVNDAQKTSKGLPLPLDQTLLKNREQFALLLEFCMEDIQEENIKCLDGLPLLLTQDQMLSVFDGQSPKQFSQFWEIFQGHGAVFADYKLNRSHSAKLQQGGYLATLTIPVAAKLLKPLLEDLVEKPDINPPDWLRKLWEFFDYEIRYKALNTKGEQGTQCFKEITEAFIDYPIVPIIIPSQKNRQGLETLRNLSSVVWEEKNPITSTLLKLGLATLQTNFFMGFSQVRDTQLRRGVLRIDDSSAVLDQLLKVPHSSFKNLAGSEHDDLLQFLQAGVKAAENPQEYQSKLRSLPLFETVQGWRQTISGNGNVFILKIDHVYKFPDLFNIDTDENVFLKHSIVNSCLLKSMKIPILTDIDFYVKFLLPSLHRLTHPQILDCVKLLLILKESSAYDSFKDQIIRKLGGIPFIRNIHGTLQVASYYFSEKQSIYKAMLPPEKFVPSAFWELFKREKQTRQLLKDLGLKHAVSEADIIEFANMIQSDAKKKVNLKELQRKSSALFKEALSFNHKHKKSNLLKQMANIKCLFPVQIQKELCDYHKPFAGEGDLVSIKGSLLEGSTDQHLIWSSMPIIQAGEFSRSDVVELIGAGALDQPPSAFVAKHLSNTCLSRCQGENMMAIRKKVFIKSYAYLQSKDFDGSQLQGLPVVLVENETVLVKASQVVLSLDNHKDFRPYLFKINPKLAIFAEFFKKIGVTERPTIMQYNTVLQDIYMDSKDKETLNPNQQGALKRVVQNLFQLISDQPKKAQSLEKLYLPSSDGKLYQSNDLFFNDTSFQTARLEHSLIDKLGLLMNLGHCYLKSDPYEHQRLLQLLPSNIRPAMLSSVISERLVQSSKKLCEYGKNCDFSGYFERRLSSSLFSHGLTCLIRQQSNGKISHAAAVEQCKNTFGRLQITCCENLATELFLDEEQLANTASDTQVYVSKEAEGCTFYLKHSDDGRAPKIINEVTMTICQEINSLLRNCLCSKFMQVLAQLLLCESMEDVEKALEKGAIRNCDSIAEGYQNPDPGSPIPEEWYDALDMNIMNNYEMGEYVGFKKTSEDDHYYYAVVTERLDKGDKKGYCRYKIQIGIDEFVEVTSFDLYQFKRDKTAAPVQSVSRDVELLNGGAGPSTERDFPNNFEDIKKEIDQHLKEIWTLTKDEQHKAIHRMYLLWHPDKNPGQKELATEAFKYLKNRIKEFQQNGHSHSSSDNFRGQNGNETSNWSWDFEEFFSRWDSEASRHHQGRQRFYQNNRRSQYDFWSFHPDMPRPDKDEAKRWFLQAQCDLNAAQHDTGGGSTEWCLFKIHQAVEKALTAAEYRGCGKRSTNCSISSLAQVVSGYNPLLQDLPRLVKRLKDLGVDAKTTQYPNYHPSPKIPNNAFQPEHEEEALDIGLELLQKVGTYLT